MGLQPLKNFHTRHLGNAVSLVKRHNLQLALKRCSGKRLYGGQLARWNRGTFVENTHMPQAEWTLR